MTWDIDNNLVDLNNVAFEQEVTAYICSANSENADDDSVQYYSPAWEIGYKPEVLPTWKDKGLLISPALAPVF